MISCGILSWVSDETARSIGTACHTVVPWIRLRQRFADVQSLKRVTAALIHQSELLERIWRGPFEVVVGSHGAVLEREETWRWRVCRRCGVV